MGGSMVQPPPAAIMEVELFSSSRPRQLANGISERSIPFTVSQTGVSLMARCSAPLREDSMEPLTTEGPMVLALFTSYLRGWWANGTRESFIVFKMEAMAIVRSAISLLAAVAIFLELRVREARAVAPCLN